MRLRVLTLNVWNNPGDPRRTEIINGELRRLNPDLVSLQEVLDTPAQNQREAFSADAMESFVISTAAKWARRWLTLDKIRVAVRILILSG